MENKEIKEFCFVISNLGDMPDESNWSSQWQK